MYIYRFFARKFFRSVSILLITFGIIVVVASRPPKNGPHPAVSEIEAYDTLGIFIDPAVRDSFPCIYDLLQRMISEKKGIFRERAFHEFFAAPSTRLIFSVRALPDKYLGAESFHAEFDPNDCFRDTVFINKLLYTRMSKEYLTSVVIHEGLHAYITWCWVCYNTRKKFGVDEAYLAKHIRKDWDWLANPAIVSDDSEHVLMSENFIRVMTKHLLVHINQSDPGLRYDIATALTWGGLDKTPRWQARKDTCYLNSIDIFSWSLNMGDIETQHAKCIPKGMRFLDSLQLNPLCQ